jgi:hypothetical protein
MNIKKDKLIFKLDWIYFILFFLQEEYYQEFNYLRVYLKNI